MSSLSSLRCLFSPRVALCNALLLLFVNAGCSSQPAVHLNSESIRLVATDPDGSPLPGAFAVVHWSWDYWTDVDLSEVEELSDVWTPHSTQNRRSALSDDGQVQIPRLGITYPFAVVVYCPPWAPTLVVPDSPGAHDLGHVPLGVSGTARGVVRDDRGQPIPGVTIQWLPARLCEPDDPPALDSVLASSSDSEGRYQLTGLPVDVPVVICAGGPNYETAMSSEITPSAGEVISRDLVVTHRPRLLSGQICREDNGEPVAGASIEIVAWQPPHGLRTLRRAHSDSRGSFSLDLPNPNPARELRLIVRATGHAPRRIDEHAVVTPGVLRHGGLIGPIELKPGIAISGRVLLPDGTPTTGGKVLFVDDYADGEGWSSWPPLFTQEVVANISDRGEFAGTCVGKRVTLIAFVPGHTPEVTPPIIVREGESTPLVSIRLPQQPDPSGRRRVIDDRGRPVAGARVLPDGWDASGEYTPTAFGPLWTFDLTWHGDLFEGYCDENGWVQLPLLPGLTNFHVEYPEHSFPFFGKEETTFVVALDDDEPEENAIDREQLERDAQRFDPRFDLDRELPPSPNTVVVAGASEAGQRATYGQVTLSISDWVGTLACETRELDRAAGDPDGELRCIGVTNVLDIQVVAHAPNYFPAQQIVRAPRDEETRVHLELTRSAEIVGFIEHCNGTLAHGGTIEVRWEVGPYPRWKVVVANQNGWYRISGLPAGVPLELRAGLPSTPCPQVVRRKVAPLKPGERMRLDDIVMGDCFSLRGSVVTTRDDPIPGAKVELTPMPPSILADDSPPLPDRCTPASGGVTVSRGSWHAVTNENGVFVVEGLAAGDYKVRAWRNDNSYSSGAKQFVLWSVAPDEPETSVRVRLNALRPR